MVIPCVLTISQDQGAVLSLKKKKQITSLKEATVPAVNNQSARTDAVRLRKCGYRDVERCLWPEVLASIKGWPLFCCLSLSSKKAHISQVVHANKPQRQPETSLVESAPTFKAPHTNE